MGAGRQDRLAWLRPVAWFCVSRAIRLIRTGDTIQYANMILISG
jgi:hypothetical protein